MAQAKPTGEGDSEDERSWREAIAAGDLGAWSGLGGLLAGQAGREEEAEAAFREAIAVNDGYASYNLGLLLSRQPGRKTEAEQAYREVIAANDRYASNHLGLLVLAGGAGDGAVPLLECRTPVDGRAAAYGCEGFSCRAPVTGAAELAVVLGD